MAKHDLIIEPPLMNAAGILGFSPDLHSGMHWSQMGAFVTNPVSLGHARRRTGGVLFPLPGLPAAHGISKPRDNAGAASLCLTLEPLTHSHHRAPVGG
jgi:hypothetical protein